MRLTGLCSQCCGSTHRGTLFSGGQTLTDSVLPTSPPTVRLPPPPGTRQAGPRTYSTHSKALSFSALRPGQSTEYGLCKVHLDTQSPGISTNFLYSFSLRSSSKTIARNHPGQRKSGNFGSGRELPNHLSLLISDELARRILFTWFVTCRAIKMCRAA